MIDISKFVEELDGRAVAVFGLGISNYSVIKALCAHDIRVVAWDDDQTKLDQAAELGAECLNLLEIDLKNFACLVLAPGVPLYFPKPHKIVEKANAINLEILCDIEILFRCHKGNKIIGITGTNGKSTTTALLTHVLNECGMHAVAAGNIGQAVLALELENEEQAIVIEVSSFQMDLCKHFSPDISLLLNLSPDHIDRHGSMENYIAAKLRMFRGEGIAVIGVDDDDSLKAANTIRENEKRDVYEISYKDKDIEDIYSPALQGEHNKQNMAAVFKTCILLGLEKNDIIRAIKTFPGLPHRQFLVRFIKDVQYINDSKATNAVAAEKALSSFDNIYWIVGGRSKEGGLKGLEAYKERIKHAYIIGEASEEFQSWFDSLGIKHTVANNLEKALSLAHIEAQKNKAGTVLLSPACASFDQFSSFEERGRVFSELVNHLKEDN
jgi:UDP-N-acetylmuramoylalanine--D-glutamate ligase